MKVNVTMNDELMKRVDSYAEQNYMSRSGLISLATTQYLNGLQLMSTLQELTFYMRKISDTGEVDEETSKRLADLECLMRLIAVK